MINSERKNTRNEIRGATREETKQYKSRQAGYTHKAKIRDETRLNTSEKGNKMR